MATPTSFLPPLKQIDRLSTPAFSLILRNLTRIYGNSNASSSIHMIDSGYASGDEEDPDDDKRTSDHEDLLELLRADPLEREFAIRWMTGFVARSSEWVSLEEDESFVGDVDDREALFDQLAALLSSCVAVTQPEDPQDGDLLREFVFPRNDGRNPIKTLLTDATLSDTDHTSVGLQTWGSSAVLAQRIIDSPQEYGLPTPDLYNIQRPFRVLELGAGTGLLSLIYRQLLLETQIPSQIIATDYHPAVLSNLRKNVALNLEQSLSSTSVSISVEMLDWSSFYDREYQSTSTIPISNHTQQSYPPPFDVPFDVIIAADVIYAPAHAEWIAASVRQLLRNPVSSHPSSGIAAQAVNSHIPSFHLIAPVRPTHSSTRSSIEAAFPISLAPPLVPGGSLPPTLDGLDYHVDRHLEIVSLRDSDKEKRSVGRADEMMYREYRIQWS